MNLEYLFGQSDDSRALAQVGEEAIEYALFNKV